MLLQETKNIVKPETLIYRLFVLVKVYRLHKLNVIHKDQYQLKLLWVMGYYQVHWLYCQLPIISNNT